MKKNYSIDWLAFTVKETELQEIIFDTLKMQMQDFTKTEQSLYGYSNTITSNKILVLFNDIIGESKQGVHIILSGTALREYEKLHNTYSLLQRLDNEKTNIKRIDLALDISDCDFLNYTLEKLKKSEFKTRFKKYTILEEHSTKTNSINGQTIYLGSRKSELYIRIYDKAAESKIQADITRIELEIKRKSAQKTAKDIKNNENLQNCVNGILKNNFNLLEEQRKANISRSKICKKWSKIIEYDNTAIYKSATEKIDTSLTQKAQWLKRQISKTYSMCNNTNLITEKMLLEHAAQKLTDTDYAIMADELKGQLHERK